MRERESESESEKKMCRAVMRCLRVWPKDIVMPVYLCVFMDVHVLMCVLFQGLHKPQGIKSITLEEQAEQNIFMNYVPFTDIF